MPIPTQPQDASGVVTDAAQDTTAIAAPAPKKRLGVRDSAGILVRAIGRARSDHATNLAQAVAFNLFLAIPSAALVAVGVFATAGDAGLAHRLLAHLAGIVPASVITLLDHSLTKVTHQSNGGVIMIVAGAVLAVWSLTGAMKTLMWALNIAHDAPERRGSSAAGSRRSRCWRARARHSSSYSHCSCSARS
jgi:membrane protein